MSNTETQAEALKLADSLETSYSVQDRWSAAAHLRRLHARVAELEADRRGIIAEKDDYKIALRHAKSVAQRAAEEEREACARIVDSEKLGFAHDDVQLNRIYETIRARSANKES